MDPYAKNPYSMQWNFGVAKQFNNATAVTPRLCRLRKPPPGRGWLLQRRADAGTRRSDGSPTLPYIHPTFYDRSIGRGNYNALQFQFNKRFSSGLAYQVAYTYSKSIDIGSSGWYGVEGQSVQIPIITTTIAAYRDSTSRTY